MDKASQALVFRGHFVLLQITAGFQSLPSITAHVEFLAQHCVRLALTTFDQSCFFAKGFRLILVKVSPSLQ